MMSNQNVIVNRLPNVRINAFAKIFDIRPVVDFPEILVGPAGDLVHVGVEPVRHEVHILKFSNEQLPTLAVGVAAPVISVAKLVDSEPSVIPFIQLSAERALPGPYVFQTNNWFPRPVCVEIAKRYVVQSELYEPRNILVVFAELLLQPTVFHRTILNRAGFLVVVRRVRGASPRFWLIVIQKSVGIHNRFLQI